MGKISYETHFKSTRADGRLTVSIAAFQEKLRRTEPKLSLPENLTEESFELWHKKVKDKYREVLRMPEITVQPAPVKLSSEKREGYTLEKWEFYPDEFMAVPFLVLIPDGAAKESRIPGVMCLLGSTHPKELVAGEPYKEKYFIGHADNDENKMALHIVKNGMAAFVFDNLGIGEQGMPTENMDLPGYLRTEMVYGYLQAGVCYPGMATWIILSFMQYLKTFDFVDMDKLAVSAHSLGTEPAMALGVLCDDIKAVVFNDFLHNDRVRFCANTEFPEGDKSLDIGSWHIIPGWWEYFDFPDLCAAIAPKFLAFNEGGADEWFDVVKRAYKLFGSEDRLQITHYEMYKDESARKNHGKVPRYGLSFEEYRRDWCYCDAPNHYFKSEPSIRLLKKAFG